MLRTWQISNFKSIREMKEPLEFAPLTIFCGANSSGKSSLLQSILLFKQTLQKKEIAGAKMALNGGLVKLGNLNEIKTDGASGEISYTFRIDDTACSIRIGSSKNRSWENVFNRYPLVSAISIPGILDCSYFDEGDLEFPVAGNYLLKGKAVFDKRVKEAWNISPGSWNVNDVFTETQKEFYARIKGKIAYHFTNAFDHFFPIVTFDDTELEAKYKLAINTIHDFFCDKLYYVGPLRADPKENSDTTSQYKGVGYRGEYTAECYALHTHKFDMSYPCFFDDYYDKFNASKKFIAESEIVSILRNLAKEGHNKNTGGLKGSFVEWLRYTEIVDAFGDEDFFEEDDDEAWADYANYVNTDENGELVIKQRTKRALRNVGFGVSQVLPIILQCIVAEPGSTIIIEQPELHLHPKTQSRLADFFLAMSLLGKQIIIETHSEYIIDKLRLRIVQASGDTLVDKIAIYFTEKKDGNSEFRRIHIDEYSVMEEWPEGFFEESMKIARDILFTARQKEQKENGNPAEDND